MKIIKLKDKEILAKFLKDMYDELFDNNSQDLKVYVEMADRYIKDCFVFTDENYKGFYIIKDSTIPALPIKRWEGLAVYIKPEYRKTKLLANFYNHMFKSFEGDILGFVEPSSDHLNVLKKRHTLVGHIYILNRS